MDSDCDRVGMGWEVGEACLEEVVTGNMSLGLFLWPFLQSLSLLAVHHDTSGSVRPHPLCHGGVISLKP